MNTFGINLLMALKLILREKENQENSEEEKLKAYLKN